jgi:hypothetical protein
MNNILYLHNGNSAVKHWAEHRYSDYRVMPCVTDEWDIGNKKISLLNDKLEFLKSNNNILFDLTSADTLSNFDLSKLATHCKILKICTTHNYDLANLEEVWKPESYNYTQWLQASMLRFWAADQIIHIKESTNLLQGTSGTPIVFTPGRCGTHVLMDILKLPTFLHHTSSLLGTELFTNLINAKEIFSVLRKSFINQVASDTIGNKIAFVLSTNINISQNVEIFKNKNLTITDQEINDSFDKLTSYADILIGLKILWNKKINFCYFEDLSSYFNSISFLKNPYDAKKIITNYNEIEDLILKNYQPAYQKMVNRIDQLFGLSIH